MVRSGRQAHEEPDQKTGDKLHDWWMKLMLGCLSLGKVSRCSSVLDLGWHVVGVLTFYRQTQLSIIA